MTFREIVWEHSGIIMRSYMMLIVFAQIALCVNAFIRKRSVLYRILNCLHLAVTFYLYTLVLDGTFRALYLGRPRDFGPAVDFVYSLPWWALALFELFETVLLILLMIHAKRQTDSEISYASVKEALDLLPEGIGWYYAGGVPTFINADMSKIATALTGDAMTGCEALWDQAQTVSKSEQPPLLLPLEDSGTYLLSRSEAEENSEGLLHLTGEDISEQYRITEELRKKHARLAHIRRRYIEYSRDLVKYEREKSLYSARADAHSELGHALLRAKTYLADPASGDSAALLNELRETNAVMINNRRGELPDASPVATAVRKAQSIGVQVEITGWIPEGTTAEIILARAVDECSSNARKHGKATGLTVTVGTDSGGITLTLKHSGSVPSGEYHEAGGLLLLRYETESVGGRMTTLTDSSFTVVITLPAE